MKIKHVVIGLTKGTKGKELKLTLDEAKALRDELNELLGDNQPLINNQWPVVINPVSPWTLPQPWYYEKKSPYWLESPIVTDSTNVLKDVILYNN
jgi:hypothetical protein